MNARFITLTTWSVVAAVVVAAIGLSYYGGRRAGALDVRRQITADSLHHVTKALELTAPVLRAQHQATQVENRKDSTARVVRAAARRQVRIVSDSQVAAVSLTDTNVVGPTQSVPPMLVELVRLDDATIAQDSITIRAQAAELGTLYRRDTLHTEREHLLEEEVAEAKGPRCGRRCGFALGAVAVYAATHPAQIVGAIVRLVKIF